MNMLRYLLIWSSPLGLLVLSLNVLQEVNADQIARNEVLEAVKVQENAHIFEDKSGIESLVKNLNKKIY